MLKRCIIPNYNVIKLIQKLKNISSFNTTVATNAVHIERLHKGNLLERFSWLIISYGKRIVVDIVTLNKAILV